jgi:hypothetical protein
VGRAGRAGRVREGRTVVVADVALRTVRGPGVRGASRALDAGAGEVRRPDRYGAARSGYGSRSRGVDLVERYGLLRCRPDDDQAEPSDQPRPSTCAPPLAAATGSPRVQHRLRTPAMAVRVSRVTMVALIVATESNPGPAAREKRGALVARAAVVVAAGVGG